MMRVAAACCAAGRLDEAEETYMEVKCAQTLSIYQNKNPQRARAAAADLGVTQCLIRKLRWQKEFLGCKMSTIQEEDIKQKQL
eukprot:CAMPEP_0183312356 /NCGR_PEP_ID=MMETSP0160_2-20130417/41338_1 /TAXON_ID=2839 ORGANISM="Odontella Sinensis, Strain Grunow 1884" /NCGR_SAMPLE_ID=MMETSP0160_2 /ASSEMBLY_ACC=CAM_ASM_000250 /LENGTH=82 /DNA_ID=CAMNT_0025477191 /DNA_START=126 /DNA_END=374 /DNA_ORIENTATION=-